MTTTEPTPHVSFDFTAAVSNELRTRIVEVNALFAPFTDGLEEKCDQAYDIIREVEQAIETAVDAVDFPADVDVHTMREHLFAVFARESGLDALTSNLNMIQVLTQILDWRAVDALKAVK